MKQFVRDKESFYNNNVSYTDTLSLYNNEKFWNVLNKAKLVRSGLYQGKNDYV